MSYKCCTHPTYMCTHLHGRWYVGLIQCSLLSTFVYSERVGYVSAVRLHMTTVCCQGRPIYSLLCRADPNYEAEQQQQISRRFRRKSVDSQKGKENFPFSEASRLVLGPTQGADGKFARAWSWPHLQLDPSLKTEWRYTCTPHTYSC